LPSNCGSQRKILYSSVLFLCLPKEKERKRKGTQPLVPPVAGVPVLLDAAGALQTRCAQTVQIPFSAASPVLGGVPMGFCRKIYLPKPQIG
jgi:hypothetical protein